MTTVPAVGLQHYAWLMLAFPVFGALVLISGGRRTDKWGHLLGALMPIEKVPPRIMSNAYAMHVGLNRALLHYPLRNRTIMNVVGLAREPKWQQEGWQIPARLDEFVALYSDFHPDALARDPLHA